MKCKYCNQTVEPVMWDSASLQGDLWAVTWICATHGLLEVKEVVGSYDQMELFGD